jgi:putative ABC transport system ATP-binding protein
MALIVVQDIRKDYTLGKTVIHALRGLDFTIERGDFIAVMGPSGCGKSTLLNMVGCIDMPTSGSVTLEGRNLAALTDDQLAEIRLGKIGFIFQSFNLIPVLTIAQNVEFPLILARMPRRERAVRVSEVIEMVGLAEYAAHKPDELSGGQRQRVAIARALVNRPSIVIADEPTANLDSENGNAVLSAMQELNERHQVTLIFSTHNPETVRYARRIIRLKDGVITDDAAVQRTA